MKILAITGNPKKKGALAVLTEVAVEGAIAAGAAVEMIRLADQDIRPCRFCLKCKEDHLSVISPCAQKDDMAEILEKIKEADGFILTCPTSSGHQNAIMKTFDERCAFTLGKPTRKILWIDGIPESRIAFKKRYALIMTTAGIIPNWANFLVYGAIREMADLAEGLFNAQIVGHLYATGIHSRGLNEADRKEAFLLGKRLARQIDGAGQFELWTMTLMSLLRRISL